MAKTRSLPKGYIIVGYVWNTRSSLPKEAHWDGKKWSQTKAKLYPTEKKAEQAAGTIDDRDMDTVEIHKMPGDLAF